MKNFDSTRSSRSGTPGAHGDVFVPAPSGFVGARSADDSFDVENWLGYESIHPLTWVPPHRTADGAHAE